MGEEWMTKGTEISVLFNGEKYRATITRVKPARIHVQYAMDGTVEAIEKVDMEEREVRPLRKSPRSHGQVETLESRTRTGLNVRRRSNDEVTAIEIDKEDITSKSDASEDGEVPAKRKRLRRARNAGKKRRRTQAIQSSDAISNMKEGDRISLLYGQNRYEAMVEKNRPARVHVRYEDDTLEKILREDLQSREILLLSHSASRIGEISNTRTLLASKDTLPVAVASKSASSRTAKPRRKSSASRRRKNASSKQQTKTTTDAKSSFGSVAAQNVVERRKKILKKWRSNGFKANESAVPGRKSRETIMIEKTPAVLFANAQHSRAPPNDKTSTEAATNAIDLTSEKRGKTSQRIVLDFLREHSKPVTAKQIAVELNLPTDSVRSTLQASLKSVPNLRRGANYRWNIVRPKNATRTGQAGGAKVSARKRTISWANVSSDDMLNMFYASAMLWQVPLIDVPGGQQQSNTFKADDDTAFRSTGPSEDPSVAPLPQQFVDVSSYVKAMFNLLLLESKAELQNDIESLGETFKYNSESHHRALVLEMSISPGGMTRMLRKRDGSSLAVRYLRLQTVQAATFSSSSMDTFKRYRRDGRLGEGSLVLCSMSRGALRVCCNARDTKACAPCVFGQILSSNEVKSGNLKGQQFLTVAVAEQKWRSLRDQKQSKTCTKLFVMPVSQPVTVRRQIAALANVRRSPLLNALLGNRVDDVSPENVRARTDRNVLLFNRWCDTRSAEGFKTFVHKTYNPSQISAIFAGGVATSDAPHFDLIQGPPGTGKTHALVGLLNISHMSEYKRYHESLLKPILDEFELVRRHRTSTSTAALRERLSEVRVKASSQRPRVLVVAPSNGAVDEVISRIMTRNFVDSFGNVYRPSIVRLGRSHSSETASVALQKRMDEWWRRKDADVQKLYIDANETLQKIDEEISASCRELHAAVKRRENEAGNFNRFVERVWGRTLRPGQSANRNSTDSKTSDSIPLSTDAAALKLRRDRAFRHAVGAAKSAIIDSGVAVAVASASAVYSRVVRNCEEQFNAAASKFVQLEERRVRTVWRRAELTHVWERKSKASRGDHDLRLAILEQADIIFATLSGSGLRVIEDLQSGVGADALTKRNSERSAVAARKIDAVIVDEAAQCVEALSLIPLKFRAKRYVLVGDPKQLPATTFSKQADRLGFNRSLFERLESLGHPVHFLDTQYRCHPDIAAFPSRRFYDGKLQNGVNVRSSEYAKPYHQHVQFAPFKFFDLTTSGESRGVDRMRRSWRNIAEAIFVVNLCASLIRACGDRDRNCWEGRKIGIITPYRAQRQEIEGRLRAAKDARILPSELNVEIDTVDGFQGREKDIIIFSCVRGRPKRGWSALAPRRAPMSDRAPSLGFLKDVRRMNVALTRAKYSLWIVGHGETLREGSETWRALYEHAQSTGALTYIESPDAPTRWATKERLPGVSGSVLSVREV